MAGVLGAGRPAEGVALAPLVRRRRAVAAGVEMDIPSLPSRRWDVAAPLDGLLGGDAGGDGAAPADAAFTERGGSPASRLGVGVADSPQPPRVAVAGLAEGAVRLGVVGECRSWRPPL